MAVTSKLPWVRVPVLSNTTVSTWASVSTKLPPLMRMPLADAPPMPPKKLSGTEITSAQGQDTTRKISARETHSPQSPVISDGNTASSSADRHTAGVYQRANFVMKFSDFALLEEAFSTSSRMRATVDSPKRLFTRTCSTPLRLMQPLITSSPG